ncbi:MAG: aspartate aminotransferase family protein [Clostridia bacterium]|nr:aspartate aminotransferase family protein [Clostridia bacterium]MBR1705084.1 aspartate aminotransferase family protein [Clostridia bacterium]
MTTKELMELDQKYIIGTYGRNPISIVRGKGATLYDEEDNEYIDFTSGIGVSSIGYGNEKWAEAIYEQAKKLGHISNLYYTEPCAKLAEQLCTRTGMSGVFFGNSGAEANEGIIKLARKYSYDKYGEGRATVLTLKDSFHGRTITTLNATGQDVFHQYFFPFTEGFRYVEANNFTDLVLKADDTVCAVLMELIQGEGGVNPLDEEYVKNVAEYCKKNDWLLLIDEVQTGVGRTGTLFAYQGYGIEPDAVSFAKGIAGGLPMGGFLVSEKCRETLGPGTHGSTFGGNPVSASAALEVLNELDDQLLLEVREKGNYIAAAVHNMRSGNISAIKGKGLMIGLQLIGADAAQTSAALASRGLLTLTAHGNVLRLLPPLTITIEEIDKGLAILQGLLGD